MLSRRDLLTSCAAVAAGASITRPGLAQTTEALEDAVPAWAIGPFTRELNGEPILTPRADTRFTCPVSGRTVAWEEKDVFNPAAVVKDGLVHLIYRAEDTVGRFAGTSRIGSRRVATDSTSSVVRNRCSIRRRTRFSDTSGKAGARILGSSRPTDGRYVMTYTSYDGKTARLCVASSRDL